MIKSTPTRFYLLAITLNLFLALFIVSEADAQNNSSSPYSRFGIGDIQSTGFSETEGMGSSSIAIHEPFNINLSNPASYSSLKLTTFEFGASSVYTKYSETGFASNTTNNTNISYVALGFPVVSNIWGASIGILPYSNVGYKISDNGTSPNGDETSYLYRGLGGINQIYLGNALNITKNLSFGANVSYLFGSIQRQNSMELPGLGSSYHTRITNTINISDLSYKFGLLFTIDSIRVDSAKYFGPKKKLNIISSTKENIIISNSRDTIKINSKPSQLKNWVVLSNSFEGISITNDKDTLYIINSLGKLKVDSIKYAIKKVKIKGDHSLTFGLTTSLNSNLNVKSDSLTERYLGSVFSNTVSVHDTINYNAGTKGTITLPLGFGFGISYKQGQRLLLSAEASMQDWSKYSAFGQNDQLTNSMRLAAGAQISPDVILAKTFFSSIIYRFGAYYSKTYLDLKSTQLDDIGFTVGLGLPVYRSLSKINIGIQVGQRGTLTNSLIREQYVRLSLGLSLADKWFIKHKYE